MTALRVRTADFEEIALGDRNVLFHVPTTSLFELDGAGRSVLQLLRQGCVPEQLVGALNGRHAPEAVQEALGELAHLGLLAERPAHRVPVPNHGLSTLVVNVTTGCNLACTYCYKEDLQTAATASRLSIEAGQAAVELLLRESGARRRINLTFFGGEPLTNLPVIRAVVDYADRRAAECGKQVDYSMTTNGLMLDDAVIEWLDSHRFGLTVSIDGPVDVHDRNRRTPGGRGSYEALVPKVRRLLDRYRSRPVGARVTVTAGATDVLAIHRHLKDELGFAEVGFAPVTAGLPAGHCMGDGETDTFFEGLKALGRRWLDEARQGRDIGFSNLSQLIRVLHEGASKRVACGAGVSLLAVDTEGQLQLCHRFTGSGLGGFGDVDSGIDHAAVETFIDGAQARTEGECASCWVRHLCAGGCYHEAYARHGDPMHITDHYCELMREWVRFGVGIYLDLMDANPKFLRHSSVSGRTV